MALVKTTVGNDGAVKQSIVCKERESKRNLLSLVLYPIIDHISMMSEDAIKEWVKTAIDMVFLEDVEKAKKKREEKFINALSSTEVDYKMKLRTVDRASGERLMRLVYDMVLAGEGMPTLHGFHYEAFLQFNPEKTSIRDVSKLWDGLSQSVGRWRLGK